MKRDYGKQARERWRKNNLDKCCKYACKSAKKRNDESRKNATKTKQPFSDFDIERLVLMVNDGVPSKEIARILHRTIASIYGKVAWLKRQGIFDNQTVFHFGRCDKLIMEFKCFKVGLYFDLVFSDVQYYFLLAKDFDHAINIVRNKYSDHMIHSITFIDTFESLDRKNANEML